MWTHRNPTQCIPISASVQQLLSHLNVCLLLINLQYFLQIILSQLFDSSKLLPVLIKLIPCISRRTELRNLIKVLSFFQRLHLYQRVCSFLFDVYHMIVSLSNPIRCRNSFRHDVHF